MSFNGHFTRRWARPWAASAALFCAAILGLAHAHLVLGDHVASAGLPLWRNPPGDLASALLGSEALLRDPAWHFPLATTDRLLTDGTPSSIVYTDSAPWISILAKAAGLSATSVSVMGLVVLLAFVMQPVAFAALLLCVGVRRVEVVVLGATLGGLIPAWYLRTLGHVALSSHWVVVLALAAAALAIRTRVSWALTAVLCALGALSIGIHAYLFVMVSAVAGSALLTDAGRQGWRALPRAFAALFAYACAAAVSAWVLGYAAGGGGVGGFGFYSMNLLSPFVPQMSGLRELLTGDPGAIVDATAGQYEGFNYLGAGVLATLVLGLACAWGRRNGPAGQPGLLKASMPLVAAGACLTALALTNQVYVGHLLLVSVKLPQLVMSVLNELRGSGRLFWPVPYGLLALALVAASQARRRWVIGAVLAVAAVLQGADTAPLRRIIAGTYASEPSVSRSALDVFRDGKLAGREIRFLPRYLCETMRDVAYVREVSLLAIRSGGRVNNGPSARMHPAGCLSDQFAASSPHPSAGRTDILLRDSLSPAMIALADQSGRCMATTMGAACGSDERSSPGEPFPLLRPLASGVAEDLTTLAGGQRLLGAGWAPAAPGGAWSIGTRSLLVIPADPAWAGAMTLKLEAQALAPAAEPAQTVTVSVAGTPVATWQIGPQSGWFEAPVAIPAGSGLIVVTLDIPDAVAPRGWFGVRGARALGIRAHSVSVTAARS